MCLCLCGKNTTADTSGLLIDPAFAKMHSIRPRFAPPHKNMAVTATRKAGFHVRSRGTVKESKQSKNVDASRRLTVWGRWGLGVIEQRSHCRTD